MLANQLFTEPLADMTDHRLAMYESADSKIGDARYFVLMAAVLLVQFFIIVHYQSTADGHLNPLFAEDGPIEALSPIGYIVCIVLIVALGGGKFAFTRALSMVAVLSAMTLRELDFHSRFTTMSITKLKFFMSGAVPLHEKIPAFIALALIAWAVLHIVVTYGRDFVSGLRRLSPMSVAASIAILMIVSSEGIDGIARPLAEIGFPIGLDAEDLFEKIEETLELGISIFAALAILAYFSARQDRAGISK